MNWTLIFWIYACAGIDCEVPAYETRSFTSEQECNTALEFWVMSSPKLKTNSRKGQHIGICVDNYVEG